MNAAQRTWISHEICLPSQVWRVEELHKQYGPHVRVAPNQVDICSSGALQKIYGHGSKYHKPKSFYDGFVVVRNHPSIFSDTDPHSHATRRKAVSAAYALNNLVKLEECVDPLVDLLIKKLYMSMSEGEDKVPKATLDMTKVMHFFAMDAVGELVSSQSSETNVCITTDHLSACPRPAHAGLWRVFQAVGKLRRPWQIPAWSGQLVTVGWSNWLHAIFMGSTRPKSFQVLPPRARRRSHCYCHSIANRRAIRPT